MMIHYVRVAVALSRPPKIDEWRRYCVVAATATEAELIAQQIAACSSVMPVESVWESSHRVGPIEPYGALDCRCHIDPWSEDVGDEDVWDIAPTCPHHSEDTAAWAALDAPTEPAECPPGVHSMFDFCPGRAICEGGWEEPDGGQRRVHYDTSCGAMDARDDDACGSCADCAGNPPTPETANAGGSDTDDTPSPPIYDDSRPRSAPGAIPPGPPPYATGAIVPDELKRRVDTVKVSLGCNCERIDVSTWLDRPEGHSVRGRTDGDCPLHGDLAQIRAFGHIDVGDRLRVNDFGVWSIDRAAGDVAPDRYAVCDCDDWWYYYDRDRPGDKENALAARDAHQTRLNTDGTPECPRSLNRRPGLAKRALRRWTQLRSSPRGR